MRLILLVANVDVKGHHFYVVFQKDKLVEFLVELGIFFSFVDQTHIAQHVTSLHESHHNHVTA